MSGTGQGQRGQRGGRGTRPARSPANPGQQGAQPQPRKKNERGLTPGQTPSPKPDMRVSGQHLRPKSSGEGKTVSTPGAKSEELSISQEKLQELKKLLKSAYEGYVQDKETENPSTFEAEITLYVTKLIDQIQMKGGTEKVKEKKQKEEMKSRIAPITVSLDKLADQIEEGTFEPTQLTDNSKTPETRDIFIKIQNVCMKLKANQAEKEVQQKIATELGEAISEVFTSPKKAKVDKKGNKNQQLTKEKQPLSAVLQEAKQQLDAKAKEYQEEVTEVSKEIEELRKELEDLKKPSKVQVPNELSDGYQKSIRDIRIKLNKQKEALKDKSNKDSGKWLEEKSKIQEKLTTMLNSRPNIGTVEKKKPKEAETPLEILTVLDTYFSNNEQKMKLLETTQDSLDEEMICLENEVSHWDTQLKDDDKKFDRKNPPLIVKARHIRIHLNEKKKAIEDRYRRTDESKKEETDQRKEFQKLLEESLSKIRSALLDVPFLLEKPPGESSGRSIIDFNEQYQVPLKIVFEIEDIVYENAKWFSGRFVEQKIVVERLIELFSYICKEELILQNKRQQHAKGNSQKRKLEEKDTPTTVKDVIDAIRQQLVEHGITAETVHDLKRHLQATKEASEKLRIEKEKLQVDLQRLSEEAKEKGEKARVQDIKRKELESDKNNLLLRLSKVAGANLTDNNPNIADLSDPNRPTKIAEEYSELYDNHWTDAYEAMENAKIPQEVAINKLSEILFDVYEECGRYAGRQEFIIKTLLVCPTFEVGDTDKRTNKKEPAVKLTAVQSKGVSELIKQSSNDCTEDIKTHLRKTRSEDKRFQEGQLEKFTSRCIELCWLMQIQAPPVHLDTDTQSGAKFDKNKYKEYTQSGKKVDYVVWPALFLSKGGSLLSKGVAQGK